MSQAELQDDLLRFESQFNALIQNADQKLESSSDPKIRYRAALNRLIYNSNSLNIALGPSPESNLLDMVTFIELSRDEFEKYWMPKLFGSSGKALAQAFSESASQIWTIAAKVLKPSERLTLQKVISDWRRRHPEQINVETVRLSAFSSEAGAKAAGLDENIGGLFASVQQSTQAVDSAKLFGERALYYAQRAPFLFRLQARLGAQEILDDTGSVLAHEHGIKELLPELQQTLIVSQSTLRDMTTTVKSVDALVSSQAGHSQALAQMNDALGKLSDLLKNWKYFVDSPNSKNSVAQLAGIADQAGRQGDRFLTKLAWLGAGLIVLFWIMALISRVAFHYITARQRVEPHMAVQNDQKEKAA